MKETIAVTGAAGFIGSNVVKTLRARGETAHTVDRNIAHSTCPPDHFIKQLDSGCVKPTIIIHMGACSDTTEKDWDFLDENNVEYSKRLYRWCAANNCRFIYASSAAVYGSAFADHNNYRRRLQFDDSEPAESHKPLNLYGLSKLEFDKWVEFREEHKLSAPPQCVGLRFFNVFGPGESHKGRMASMAYHAWKQLKATGTVKLFEPGTQKRDFVYIDDVVRWIMQIVDRPEVSGIFNVGTGKAETFESLAGGVIYHSFPNPSAIEVSMMKDRIQYIPMPADLVGRYQDFTEAKMEKLRALGIATDPTPLDVACEKYVMWLEENE